ncbi:fused MFS/spermidine synthase [Candidatus Sumerlaeota bacterium]|nr:fused MFS/spermidine synthase [Candidatus Sumerlaeota bacterium]
MSPEKSESNAQAVQLSPVDWSGRTWLVLTMFVASGASGLIYEVVWSRMLTYLFGATLMAIVTVLAAYMGGLALGSWLIGKRADHSPNPLKLYALLELIVGVSAALSPALIKAMNPLLGALYGAPLVFPLVRFALAFLVLLIPTTCMGATLPVLSRWAARKQDVIGVSIGRLYAANTIGAVAGVLFAGFLGLSHLTMLGTLGAAAAINLLVAALAFGLSKGEAPLDAKSLPDEPLTSGAVIEPITPKLQRLVTWVYCGSGFVALAYQVVWFRSLVFSFQDLKNTTYAFSAMLAVFLIGLALGSSIGSKVVDTLTHPVRTFAIIQFGIGVCGILSFYMIFSIVPGWQPFVPIDAQGGTFFGSVMNMLAQTAGGILLPTFLMGLAYPVAVKCVVTTRDAGRAVARLYALNTIGAIAGAIIGGLVIVRLFGLTFSLYVLALINCGFGLWLMMNLEEVTPQQKNLLAVLIVVAAALVWWRMPDPYQIHSQLSIKSPTESLADMPPQRLRQFTSDVAGFLHRVQKTLPNGRKTPPQQLAVAYLEGPMATVAVVQNSIGDRTLEIDNVGVAGTDKILLTDQKSLAHVPALFIDEPKSALTVGFGSGGASWSYLTHPYLKRVHCVEICRTAPRMAPFLRASNHGLLDETPEMEKLRKRYALIIEDARSYLRFTDEQYDIIATDCTDLRYKTNANLYDVEYFELCRDHITPKGMVVVWMPLAGLSREAFLVALRTFNHVFANMQIYYMNNYSTHYILLLGTHDDNPLKINVNRMAEKLAIPSVKADLAEIELDSVEKLLSCFITDAGALHDALYGDPAEAELLNTENNPYLEFKSPLFGYGDQAMLDNLRLLADHRKDAMSCVDPAHAPADLAERMKPYAEALPHIIQGHEHYRHNEMIEAHQEYAKAREINPDDRSVQELLRFDELRRKIKSQPDNYWALTMMGEILSLENKRDEAFDYYRRALAALAPQLRSLGSMPTFNLERQKGILRIYALSSLGMAEYLAEKTPEADLQPYLKAVEEIVKLIPGLDDIERRLAKLKPETNAAEQP